MKQGREASSTCKVPRLFPRWSPSSTSSAARTHSAASQHDRARKQRSQQPSTQAAGIQACAAAALQLTPHGAAEHDCSELPSPPLKHVGYCSHSFLSPWCHTPAHFGVTRALLGAAGRNAGKKQHRREKEIHETEDTGEWHSCCPGTRFSSGQAGNPQLTPARGNFSTS